MTESQLRKLFPTLGELADNGSDGALDILQNFERDETEFDLGQIKLIEVVVGTYGLQLFPTRFGDMDIIKTRMDFPTGDGLRMTYILSENDYAGCGVTITDKGPQYMHLNDRTISVNMEGRYSMSLQVVLEQMHDFWDGAEPKPYPAPPSHMTGFIPPLVDCRTSLDADDHPREFAVMMLVEALVKQHSPHAARVLFHTEQPGYNIETPKFALRTYDRHSGNPLHTWNFVWRDFAVQWYGRSHRTPTFNRELSNRDVTELLSDVVNELHTYRWLPEPPPEKLATPASMERAFGKLERNGNSGSYSNRPGFQYYKISDRVLETEPDVQADSYVHLRATMVNAYRDVTGEELSLATPPEIVSRLDVAHEAGLLALDKHINILTLTNTQHYTDNIKAAMRKGVTRKSDIATFVTGIPDVALYSDADRLDVIEAMEQSYSKAYLATFNAHDQ
jgi:hypothetical protein